MSNTFQGAHSFFHARKQSQPQMTTNISNTTFAKTSFLSNSNTKDITEHSRSIKTPLLMNIPIDQYNEDMDDDESASIFILNQNQ